MRFDRIGEQMLLVCGEVEVFWEQRRVTSADARSRTYAAAQGHGFPVGRWIGRAGPENTTDPMAFLMLPTGQPKVAANEKKASHEAHSKRHRGARVDRVTAAGCRDMGMLPEEPSIRKRMAPGGERQAGQCHDTGNG